MPGQAGKNCVACARHPAKIFIPIAALLAAALMQAALSTRAFAQDSFPNRQIRLVVPYAPGASSDVISRIVATEAAKILGQPIVIDSRPGGGTVIGTRVVSTAPADGYTLLYQTPSLVSNLVAMKEPGYSISDFTPVAMLATVPYVLMIPSSVPAKTLGEFIAYAKARKTPMHYGSLGRGGRPQTLAHQLGVSGKFDWVEVPFKGAGDASIALIGDSIQGYFGSQPFAVQQKDIDKLRLLAITSEQRFDLLPEVATFKESGFPEMTSFSWYALFARSGTPAPVLQKLQSAFAEAMRSPDVRGKLRDQGLSFYSGTLAQFHDGMKQELDETTKDFARLGIKPE